MLALIALHVVVAAAAPLLVQWFDRRAFLVLALAPAAGFAWALTQTRRVSGQGAGTLGEVVPWIDGHGVDLAFRLDTLSWLMTLLVSGIGALVLIYCAWYFRPGDPGIWRFSGLLTGFAGAMLGLVLADDLVLLYIFWELTTVLSYLLIGHNPERKANRRAAMQALIVTTFGGLSMLVGIVIVGQTPTDANPLGTYRITEVLAHPPGGTAVTVALVLMLAGAVSKAALLPFHFWLPGAMAAPTPVSAYLHAAAMVKAGVFLVALLAPTFAGVMPWRPIVITLGVATMLLGGLRALRQHDLKLLLAYGTVSQLGFLVVLVGVGTRAAALAGVAMLLAHALFKGSLFLVVGVIDRCTGTRDLRELSGLRTTMPVLFATAVAAAASMAGIPPLAGFVAKETAYSAFVDIAGSGDGTGLGSVAGALALAGIVAGSVLTVAYSARFVWGAFTVKVGVGAPELRRPVSAGFTAAPVALSTLGLLVGLSAPIEQSLLEPYARQFPAGAHEASLALWHGLNPALWLSALTLALGWVLFRWRVWVEAFQARFAFLPDLGRGYNRLMRGIDRSAVEVTGATQRGSLAIYLSIILLVVVAVPGGALLGAGRQDLSTHLWDTPAQAVVGAIMVAAAVLTVRSRRRLRAAVLVGVTGYGVALLFVLHGAPDLALTQVLVETVTLVLFVLVLRRLPPYFSDRPLTRSRWFRMALGLVVGAVAAGAALVASGARVADPVSLELPDPTVSYGGGNNIVNVTLVDTRAWDTMGEISVLAVAATGVASLIFLITGRTGRWRPDQAIADAAQTPQQGRAHRNTWLRAGRTLRPERRSIIFEVVTRLAFHPIMLFSLYLLFSGHNSPGGGFAGGLVGGLALMVRYLAGGRHELDEAAPVDAGLVLGLGLFTATMTGMLPLLWGGDVLQSAIVDLHVPLLGDIHLVTSLFFDIGVYLVVFGVMLDVLRSLGGGVDRQREDDDRGPDESAADRMGLETVGEAS